MSTHLSWSPAQVALAAQASKALNIINQVNYNCNFSFNCKNQLGVRSKTPTPAVLGECGRERNICRIIKSVKFG